MEAMMKRALVLAAAIGTTACSPALFAVPGRTYPLAAHAGHSRPQVEQLPIGRWDNVMRLPRGSTIDVLSTDGAANIGAITGADVRTVRVIVEGTEVSIARADVVRVDLVKLAGSDTVAVARKATRGAVLGAGLVALVTGVVGGEAWPPPAVALRAGAAAGGLSAGQGEVLRRAGRVVYLAPQQGIPAGSTPYR